MILPIEVALFCSNAAIQGKIRSENEHPNPISRSVAPYLHLRSTGQSGEPFVIRLPRISEINPSTPKEGRQSGRTTRPIKDHCDHNEAEKAIPSGMAFSTCWN
jgi:hypothetical protein